MLGRQEGTHKQGSASVSLNRVHSTRGSLALQMGGAGVVGGATSGKESNADSWWLLGGGRGDLDAETTRWVEGCCVV
jgi:hypothetical protein